MKPEINLIWQTTFALLICFIHCSSDAQLVSEYFLCYRLLSSKTFQQLHPVYGIYKFMIIITKVISILVKICCKRF